MTEKANARGHWNTKERLIQFSKEYMVVFALILLMIIFTIFKPTFLTGNNQMTILLQAVTISIVAIGQGILLITGMIDLSFGFNICLSCFVAATLMNDFGVNPWLALLVGVMSCVIVGLLNGIFAAYVKVPPFIATLAMMNVCKGLSRIVTNTRAIAPLPQSIGFIGRGYLGPVPWCVMIMLALFVIMHFVMRRTKHGRNLYAIGSNPEAAFFSGIDVKLNYLKAYLIAGLCAGISAMILLSRMNSASVTNGNGYEFEAMIGAVVGGVSQKGGKGHIFGILFGVLFSVTLFNGMTMLNVNAFLQDVFKGIVLLAAVSLDIIRNARKV